MSSAIGPLTGGALIALFGVHDGWRAVFFVNLPIGVAILLLARRYLPAPTAAERRPQAIDPLGVVLLGAAILCILVPFIEQRSWHSSLRVALFPLGAVLLVVWVLHERRYGRTREPLVSLDLFRIRSYALGAPVGLIFFAGFIALFFIQTQYLQLGLGYPAWKSGLAVTPFAIGSALVASAGSRQALRRGPKLVAFGLAMVLVGIAGVWLAVRAHPGYDVALWIALPLLIAGLGSGLVISPNLTLTLSRVPVAARRQRRRRAADRSADRLGRRHRDHRHASSTTSSRHRTATSRRRSATASSASPRSSPPRSRSCWRTRSRATLESPAQRRSSGRVAECTHTRVRDGRASGEERDCRPGRIETSLCASAGVRGWGNSRGPVCPRAAARLWRHSCRSRACNIRAPASTGRVGFGHEAFAGVVLAIRA